MSQICVSNAVRALRLKRNRERTRACNGNHSAVQRLEKKCQKFAIKSETRLQSVFDFQKIQFSNFYNFS